jgi:hypothetical protein
MKEIIIKQSTLEQIMKTICDVSVANKELSHLACYMDDLDVCKVMGHADQTAEALDGVYYELRSITALDPRNIDKIEFHTRYLELHVGQQKP